MKTNKLFLVAALACATVFTSCSNEDNPNPQPTKKIISFENALLNADGYWIGNTDGEKFQNYGSDAYACKYVEQGVTFPVNFTPAWDSWSGFAVSNRTETGYVTMTPDQYNNITGRAHGGSNFCLVQTYGETINLNGATVKGFWYTNSSYTADAYVNGDGMTPGKFEADDWFRCVLYPTPVEGVGGARYEIYLAKDGDYVKDWQYCDLSNVDAFKNIKSISFAFEGTKANDWGVTTPAYICIDDIEIEK
jgi:hypothetical protein